VGARLGRHRDVSIEVRADHVLAGECLPVRSDEDRDAVAAGSFAEQQALFALDRHLARDVVDAELGQPLPHAAGGRAPLGLPELVHQVKMIWPPAAFS
jgi:hypothetical protein